MDSLSQMFRQCVAKAFVWASTDVTQRYSGDDQSGLGGLRQPQHMSGTLAGVTISLSVMGWGVLFGAQVACPACGSQGNRLLTWQQTFPRTRAPRSFVSQLPSKEAFF